MKGLVKGLGVTLRNFTQEKYHLQVSRRTA